MRCDEQEIPEPVDPLKPDGWWLAAVAQFEGDAYTQHVNGALAERRSLTLVGPCALYVGGGRLAGIVSPVDTTEPALWLVAPASSLQRGTLGAQGLRGRPESIDVSGDGWRLRLADVSALYRNSGQYQTGQEAGLLKALAAASLQPATAPSTESPDASRTPPEDRRLREWRREDALAGLRRLHLDGEPTPTTALVDRELSRGDQMRALSSLDWVPPAHLVRIFRATQQGAMPTPYLDPLPDGRVLSPFFVDFGAVADLDAAPPDHPVHRYLWPSREGNDLLQDESESIIASWSTPEVAQDTRLSTGKRGAASTQIPADVTNLRVFLTTTRVAVLGDLKPPPLAARDDYSMKLTLVSPALDDLRASVRQYRRWRDRDHLGWGAQFRTEWIYEVGARTRSVPSKKGGLFSKPVLPQTSESLFFRIRVPHGATCELSFPGSALDERPVVLARVAAESIAQTRPGAKVEELSPREEQYGIGGGRSSTEVDTAFQIANAVPWSLPPLRSA